MSTGLALLCDLNGNLIEVLRDPQELAAGLQPGMPFARLTARGSLGKALSFLAEIRSQGAAFNWEISIQSGSQIRTLHFSGGKSNDVLVIAGAESGEVSLALYEEMMRISNEQTNTLRAIHKEIARTEALFDEISRLNNELVDMQRELARQKAELERLNAEKNRYLGMAAHDLRNPLHAIMMTSEFLLNEDLPKEAHEFLQVIYETSQFMAHLIDDLLTVARIEAGELHLDYSPVDLPALLRRNAAINRQLAMRKGIELVYDLPTDLPCALLDAAKFEQILNNLIGNAIKFSPPGGKINIRLQAQGEMFILSVRDQGPGISPERMKTLFRPFQRGETGTGGEKSIGLGLSIVKRIVEGHGGQIWVESQPGQGATFYVSMPFQPAQKKETLQ